MAQSSKKAAAEEAAAPQPQAGTVITPGQTVDLHTPGEAPPEPAQPAPPALAAMEVPDPKPAPPTPKPAPAKAPVAAAELPPEPQVPVSQPAETGGPELLDEDEQGAISWSASEFVAHDKTPGWYALLLITAGVFAVGVYLLTKDMVSAGVVVVAAIILAVFASHKPREQRYILDDQGIVVGQRRYDYDDYKSFAVTSEGAFSSLVFMPLKRFAVPLTIYYAPEDEERIVSLLSERLPLEEHRLDAVDNLMRRIRF